MTALTSYFSGMRASVRPVLRLRGERLWEIDALRGVAIIMMVIYHLLWDLSSLGGYDIAMRSGFWGVWQNVTASLFTGLVGVSMTLSYARARAGQPGGSLWPMFARRGLFVFSWGMVISVVTYLALGPSAFVRFGILHLIGFSIVIAYPLLRFRWLNLALGVGVIALAPVFASLSIDTPWLEWLAATPGHGVDYAPLIPWFGRVLIGIFIGNTLYRGGERRFTFDLPFQNNGLVTLLRLMGQNSLLIYLLHQPILLATLSLLGVIQLF
jgi:uncharacterized membrane protein